MRALLLCASLLLVACNEPRREPPPTPGAVSTTGMALIEAPAGDVRTLVQAANANAAAAGRKVVVYAGASWCEPCEYFRAAAKAGELDAHFADVDLLVFDVDRDRDRLKDAGYSSTMIPLLVVPEADGSPSTRRMTGSIKGPGAVAEMTPRLKKLLER